MSVREDTPALVVNDPEVGTVVAENQELLEAQFKSLNGGFYGPDKSDPAYYDGRRSMKTYYATDTGNGSRYADLTLAHERRDHTAVEGRILKPDNGYFDHVEIAKFIVRRCRYINDGITRHSLTSEQIYELLAIPTDCPWARHILARTGYRRQEKSHDIEKGASIYDSTKVKTTERLIYTIKELKEYLKTSLAAVALRQPTKIDH